jgi:hypothetical protein
MPSYVPPVIRLCSCRVMPWHDPTLCCTDECRATPWRGSTHWIEQLLKNVEFVLGPISRIIANIFPNTVNRIFIVQNLIIKT